MTRWVACLLCCLLCVTIPSARAQTVVNDVTQLNPISVSRVVAPKSIDDVRTLVREHDGPVSIGGGRFSQGGQIATDNALFIDMRQLNHIVQIDPIHRRITVQAGATWRQVQEAIDPFDLSPMIMQSYSNFTVGGALSVNCHGRYVGKGPIVESVVSLRMVMADGSLVTASRSENRDLLFAAIGGYGGIGVIVEATLQLESNQRIERTAIRMALADYRPFFQQTISGSSTVVMHSATLYPPEYSRLNVVTSNMTDKPLTVTDRLQSTAPPSATGRTLLGWLANGPGGKWVRQHIYDPAVTNKPVVEMRNFEAAQDVNQLEPASRTNATFVLQEYFIPEDRLESFAAGMRNVLKNNDVNVLNVSIRHAAADTDTLLNWAPHPVFAFVIYFEQGTTVEAREQVTDWTRQLIDLALTEGGTYYLPYQIVASPEQFLKAYPRAPEFFALKARVDPSYKFRNRLWDAYYRP